MPTKKKPRIPGAVFLVIGLVAFFSCLHFFLPVVAAQLMCDLMPQAAEMVEGTCTKVDYHDDNTVTVVAEYASGDYIYENTFEDVNLGSDRELLSKGDKITLYIFDDNIFFYDAINNNIENTNRSNKMFLLGVGMFVGFVLVVVGIIVMIINSKAKKQERLNTINNNSYYNGGNAVFGSQSYSPPPQPVYPPIENSMPANQPPVYPPVSRPSAPPPVYPPVSQPSAPQTPVYPPVNSQPVQKQNNVTPSEDGYTSLDFSKLPPSKPMTVNDEPFVSPKTIEEDPEPIEEPAPQTFSAAPPEPQPEAAPVQSAPSEPVDLNSIIKKGTDDPFQMKAEDYQTDPSLEALIKKGADDPFNMKAEDYQTDPSLEALIRKGSDDPFNGGLKKEPRKRRKKKEY